MAHYFLVHDSAWFQERLRPALTASRQRRSFEPCQALCAELVDAARRYAATYHVSTEGSLSAAVVAGLPFDRHLWRCLVGEALLYGAREIPEIPWALDSLTCLLAPGSAPRLEFPRKELVPVLQTHFGSRELQFGSAIYRPDQIGVNDTKEVQRLAQYLGSVNPETWSTAYLGDSDEFGDEEGREAELGYVRESFPALLQLYGRACERKQIIVCESA